MVGIRKLEDEQVRRLYRLRDDASAAEAQFRQEVRRLYGAGVAAQTLAAALAVSRMSVYRLLDRPAGSHASGSITDE